MNDDALTRLGCGMLAFFFIAGSGIVGFILWMIYILVTAIAGALN